MNFSTRGRKKRTDDLATLDRYIYGRELYTVVRTNLRVVVVCGIFIGTFRPREAQQTAELLTVAAVCCYTSSRQNRRYTGGPSSGHLSIHATASSCYEYVACHLQTVRCVFVQTVQSCLYIKIQSICACILLYSFFHTYNTNKPFVRIIQYKVPQTVQS